MRVHFLPTENSIHGRTCSRYCDYLHLNVPVGGTVVVASLALGRCMNTAISYRPWGQHIFGRLLYSSGTEKTIPSWLGFFGYLRHDL